MPRYYFDTKISEAVTMDATGLDFDDDEAALLDARDAARHLAADRIKAGTPFGTDAIIVKGSDRQDIGVAALRDAVWEGLGP